MHETGEQLIAGDDRRGWLRNLLGRRFRANPKYRLVAHQQLDAVDRESLAGLADRPDHYGVLVPDADASLGVQAVDSAGAELFASMGRPRLLPAELRDSTDPEAERRVALLVLDGILEIEEGAGFVGGPAAAASVLAGDRPEPVGQSRIAEISLSALQRAQHLPINDPRQLSSWLYSYNTMPVDPRWVRRLQRAGAVDIASGLGASGDARRLLESHYVNGTSAGWSSWELVEKSASRAGGNAATPTYKIYVSPLPNHLAEVVPVIVQALVAHQVPAFKTGIDVYGLLRPDKFMVYFHGYDSLVEFADDIQLQLQGLPAQGVPFTAPLDEFGMLSWGIDPPSSERIRGFPGSESWRVWVASRLARALLMARAAGSDLLTQPWQYAIERISLEGIDPHGWFPDSSIWAGSTTR